MEIAGNAIENACKWCKAKVRVRAAATGPDRFAFTVEDDGPGLTPAEREAVVRRGERLDESAPGSGLGLSIVDELARAYRGALKLEDSSLGGLRLAIDLPRSAA
jgi:signal transduction histidine kinase